MPPSPKELQRILAIGHDTSMRGEGISLSDAIRRTQYVSLRARFNAADLVPVIRAHPELILQWLMYSEDKRTNGGCALEDNSPEQVADYVIRELDFWASVGNHLCEPSS